MLNNRANPVIGFSKKLDDDFNPRSEFGQRLMNLGDSAK